jgi:hypothetical protein
LVSISMTWQSSRVGLPGTLSQILEAVTPDNHDHALPLREGATRPFWALAAPLRRSSSASPAGLAA